MQKLFVSALIIIIQASCSSNKEPSQSESTVTEIQAEAPISYEQIDSATTPNLDFLKGDLNITSLKHSASYPSSDQDSSQCLEWRLDQETVRSILSHSTYLYSSDWHYLYEHLPCVAEVTFIIEQDTIVASINGGSFLFIEMRDSSLLLSDTLQEHEAFFLSSPASLDEME